MPRRPGRPVYHGWWIVAGLSVTELVSWGVLIYAYPVLVIPMHDSLGWSYSELNAAYATSLAVSGVAGVPVGWWLQRHGPRALMTAGSVLTVLALVGWALVRSLPEFFAIFVVAGLAMSMTLYEPALATTSAWFSTYRARAVLVITAVAGLASLVFAPLTAWLIGGHGWRGALPALAIIAAAVGLPIHCLVLRRAPGAPSDDPAGAGPAGGARPAERSGAGWRGVYRRPSFAWVVACLALGSMVKSVAVVGLATYLVSRGYGLALAALAAGGLGLFQICGRIAVIALRARWQEQHVAAIVCGAQAIAVGPLLLTSGHGAAATVAVTGFVIVFGCGCGLVEILRGTLLPEFYGVADYPSVNGLVALFVNGARAVAPLAIGMVLTVVGTLTPALAVTAFLAAACGGALLLADRAFRAEEAGPALGAASPAPGGR